MSYDNVLDALELRISEEKQEGVMHECKDCHMFHDCKFYEQKTGTTLCEVLDNPYFSNPERKEIK